MKKRTLNTQIGEPEHAWLKVAAKRDGVTMTAVLRRLIKEDMRREIAAEAIALGLRCSWEGCANLPAHDRGDRPDLCAAHQDAAEAKRQDQRKRARG